MKEIPSLRKLNQNSKGLMLSNSNSLQGFIIKILTISLNNMFCKKCGNKIEESSQFCQKCGERIGAVNPAESKEQNLSAKKFFGNTFNIFNSKSAFLFGVLMILIGLQNISYLIAGVAVILGTFAYKSAKSRMADGKLQFGKQILEIVLLVLIFVVIGWQNNIKIMAVEDPVPNVLIPAVIVTAYIVALFSNRFGQNKKKRLGIIFAILIATFFLIALGFQLIPNNNNSLTESTAGFTSNEMSWQTFSPTTGFFNVLLPVKPTYEFSTYGLEDGVQTSYNQELYQSRVGDNLFIIKRITYPVAVDLETDPESMLDSMVEFVMQNTPSATLTTSNFTSGSKDKFMDFVAKTTEGVYIKGRFILADQVIYQLYLYSTDGGNSNYNKFIESFEHR